MDENKPNIAEQIAQVAIAFQKECTGRTPESVTVLLGEETLLLTLYEALSPGEKEMALTPEGAARVHEYHQQLFKNSSPALHRELKRILGVEVQESTVEIDSTTGRLQEILPSGALVQVFRLAHSVATQAWSTSRKK